MTYRNLQNIITYVRLQYIDLLALLFEVLGLILTRWLRQRMSVGLRDDDNLAILSDLEDRGVIAVDEVRVEGLLLGGGLSLAVLVFGAEDGELHVFAEAADLGAVVHPLGLVRLAAASADGGRLGGSNGSREQ